MKFESIDYQQGRTPEGDGFNVALEQLTGVGSPVAPVLESMSMEARAELDRMMNMKNLAWQDLINADNQESLAATIGKWGSANSEERRLIINEILGHF